MDSKFMRKVRSKLLPGNLRDGEGDVGEEGLSKDIPGGRAREDVSVSVTNPPPGTPETQGMG